jgi:hypothetical protein
MEIPYLGPCRGGYTLRWIHSPGALPRGEVHQSYPGWYQARSNLQSGASLLWSSSKLSVEWSSA